MNERYWLTQLPDHVLVRDLAASVAQHRSTTALMLAQLAEVDARRLYAPAGYPSMFEYCVRELRMSEDSAYKRIRAARAARQYPAIFDAVADGRLHLSAVVLLAPHLAPESADELLAAGEHRTKAGIEQLLAQRFPQPDLVTMVRAIPSAPRSEPGAATTLIVETEAAVDQHATRTSCQLAPGPVGMTCARQVAPNAAPSAPPPPPAKLAPLAPERFALQVTLSQATHDKLRYVQALPGHALPAGEIAQVLDRALDALIGALEHRKFAARAGTHSAGRRGPANARQIPAAIRRGIWQRDDGRCTFVSDAGHRCATRTRLECDHVEPVARAGATTAANLRLRCRAHNQHEAERVFGAAFMERKRRPTRHASVNRDAPPPHDATRARNAALECERAAAASSGERNADVIAWLRRLGFRADEARSAAAACALPPDSPLEERVRGALRSLAPRGRRVGGAVASAPA